MDFDTRAFGLAEKSIVFERKTEAYQTLYAKFLRDRSTPVEQSEPEILPGANEKQSLRQYDIAKRQYVLKFLVDRKFVSDCLAGPAEIRQDLRLQVIGMLWVCAMWHEPWVSLVNRELPGTGPSQAEKISFTANRTQEVRHTHYAHIVANDILRVLAAADYEPDLAAKMIAFELGLSALLNDNRLRPFQLRANATEIIRNGTRRFPHPGWSNVLDKFFPKI